MAKCYYDSNFIMDIGIRGIVCLTDEEQVWFMGTDNKPHKSNLLLGAYNYLTFKYRGSLYYILTEYRSVTHSYILTAYKRVRNILTDGQGICVKTKDLWDSTRRFEIFDDCNKEFLLYKHSVELRKIDVKLYDNEKVSIVSIDADYVYFYNYVNKYCKAKLIRGIQGLKTFKYNDNSYYIAIDTDYQEVIFKAWIKKSNSLVSMTGTKCTINEDLKSLALWLD